MDKQEGFPFIARADESQKNAIVIDKAEWEEVDFEALAWVLRARSTDKERPNLCGVYSDGTGLFVATDGHRMHLAEIPEFTERIPAGLWLYVHSDKKKISIREAPSDMAAFPPYDKLVDPSEQHTSKGHVVGEDSMTVWTLWELVKQYFNINYLMDICRGSDAFEVIASREPSSAIFFYAENPDGRTRKAVLMPLKKQAA